MKRHSLLSMLVVSLLGIFSAASPSHAVLYDIYLTTSARGDNVGSLVQYQYDSVAGTVNPAASYALPVGNGAISRDYGALSLSGDGRHLVFASYVTSTNYINTFDLTTKTLSNVAQTPRGSGQSTYRSVWSLDGQSFYAVGNNSGASPGYFGTGSTTATLVRNATAEFKIIGYYNDRLYLSRGGESSNSGIWQFNNTGLPTTTPVSANTTLLSGTGWTPVNGGYGGFAFLGENTLFVTNYTTDTIQVFTNSNPSNTAGWNLYTQVSTVVGGVGTDPLQLSLLETEEGIRLFFTTNTASSGSAGTSAFGTVAWQWNGSAWEFGGVSILASSTEVMFTGIAAVPEPGTAALLGLGFGMVLLLREGAWRRAAKQTAQG